MRQNILENLSHEIRPSESQYSMVLSTLKIYVCQCIVTLGENNSMCFVKNLTTIFSFCSGKVKSNQFLNSYFRKA